MADVLSPPAPSSTSPAPDPSDHPSKNDGLPSFPSSSRPRPRERPSSYGHDRMSTLSQHSRISRSRPVSTMTASTAFGPSIPFTIIRDFAYPDYHPMHFGPPPDSQSEPPTPSSEWTSSRRLSDPADTMAKGSYSVGGNWSAGSWGGDGGVYLKSEPNSEDHGPEALPRTSFGELEEESEESGSTLRKQHRKSRSFTDISDYERGRKRDSTYNYQNRDTDDYGGGGSFSAHQTDPAGRDTLRQSRSYGYSGPSPAENGGLRRNSHMQMLLSSRTYGSSGGSNNGNNNNAVAHDHPLLPADHENTIDYDNDMPLDAEPTHSILQRQSTCPEDEELFAGRSLALYDFVPQNTNELPLREGQVIWISYRHGNGWLVGEDPATGEQGLVPEAYVRLLSELPHYDEATGRFIELEEDGEHEVSEQATNTGLVETTNMVTKEVEDLRVDEGYTAL